jgi:WS/DGAT/MGAT family acyltransferase
MGRFVTRWPDPKTVFKGQLGKKKLAVWSEPISLPAVKQIGRTFNATVNDVLLSIVTGALREYLLKHGEAVDRGDLHSFIPVNLRPEEYYNQLGNRFGLVFLSLPVDIADPLERLLKTKENMDELKSSPEAFATMGLFHLLGAVPSFQKVALNIFDSKGTAVTTNVPGPQEQLYLAGAPINTVMAWVPKSGHVGLGISIISYNGQIWMGVTTDAGLVPDPETLIELFHQEFLALQAKAEKTQNKNRSSLAPALEKLGETLDTLDDIISTDVYQTRHEKSQSRSTKQIKCKAITKSGKPCKNKPLSGEEYCRVHHKKHAEKTVSV